MTKCTCYFFFPGRCVSALAAADFASFEDDGERRTFDAAVAAFLLVTSFLAISLSPLRAPARASAFQH